MPNEIALLVKNLEPNGAFKAFDDKVYMVSPTGDNSVNLLVYDHQGGQLFSRFEYIGATGLTSRVVDIVAIDGYLDTAGKHVLGIALGLAGDYMTFATGELHFGFWRPDEGAQGTVDIRKMYQIPPGGFSYSGFNDGLRVFHKDNKFVVLFYGGNVIYG